MMPCRCIRFVKQQQKKAPPTRFITQRVDGEMIRGRSSRSGEVNKKLMEYFHRWGSPLCRSLLEIIRLLLYANSLFTGSSLRIKCNCSSCACCYWMFSSFLPSWVSEKTSVCHREWLTSDIGYTYDFILHRSAGYLFSVMLQSRSKCNIVLSDPGRRDKCRGWIS